MMKFGPANLQPCTVVRNRTTGAQGLVMVVHQDKPYVKILCARPPGGQLSLWQLWHIDDVEGRPGAG